MQKFAFIISLIVLILQVNIAESQIVPAPRYTWASFQRFWNVNSLSHIDLLTIPSIEDGYIFSINATTSLSFKVQKELVMGLRAHFRSTDNEGGGLKFLDVMRYIINIGTYRWPAEKKEEVLKHFKIMSPAKKIFKWRNSLFICQQLHNEDWEFSLDFIDFTEE